MIALKFLFLIILCTFLNSWMIFFNMVLQIDAKKTKYKSKSEFKKAKEQNLLLVRRKNIYKKIHLQVFK